MSLLDEMKKALDVKNSLNEMKESIKIDSAKFDGDTTVYLPHIPVTTTPPQGAYEVIAVIFAVDVHKEGIFVSARPEIAFVGAINKLKEQCEKLGGTAVVSTQFEYRVSASLNMNDKAKQAVEIFAYGTVIKEYGQE